MARRPSLLETRSRAMRAGSDSIGFRMLRSALRDGQFPASGEVVMNFDMPVSAMVFADQVRCCLHGGLWFMAQSALPDSDHIPRLSLKSADCSGIARSVGSELRSPELGPRSWDLEISAIRMGMPEAAIDEYCSAPFRKDQVRPAWQSFVVQPEPKSHRPKSAPNDFLRLRIAVADARHHP